ncbi:hypothetical protein CAPTEDRAFT_79798, partial [Capitella teleta]
VCEDAVLRISCPENLKFQILSSKYGRKNREICATVGDASAYDIDCACDGGLGSCDLYAFNLLFADPCTGTPKYLEVEWKC